MWASYLVVDDDPVVRIAIQKLGSRPGSEIITADLVTEQRDLG